MNIEEALKLDELIGTAMGFEVRWFDTGFGRVPYAYNNAGGPKSILGGSQQKGRADSGEIVEFFGRPLPRWSLRIAEAHQLLGDLYWRIENHNHSIEVEIAGVTRSVNKTEKIEEDTAYAICVTWLAAHGIEYPSR